MPEFRTLVLAACPERWSRGKETDWRGRDFDRVRVTESTALIPYPDLRNRRSSTAFHRYAGTASPAAADRSWRTRSFDCADPRRHLFLPRARGPGGRARFRSRRSDDGNFHGERQLGSPVVLSVLVDPGQPIPNAWPV